MTQHCPQPATLAETFPARPRRSLYAGPGKRLLDVALVLAALPVALPLLFAAAALAGLDGHSPLFAQPRLGRDGRRFALLKIRTMVPEAEARLAGLLAGDPTAAREWAETQKLRHDPRVTRRGAVLRRSSLDELPQLWNVLRGDMSLVGPRPMLPEQRPLYPGGAYESLRPGLTGLWQVQARNAAGFAERAAYDSQYASQISLRTDLRILARTLPAVFRQTGC